MNLDTRSTCDIRVNSDPRITGGGRYSTRAGAPPFLPSSPVMVQLQHRTYVRRSA